MVGKNNSYLRESKSNEHFKRFSLRKLSVGVVSVAIAAGFYLGNGTTAQAATAESATPAKTEQVEQQDSNTTVASAASASNSSSVNAVVLKSSEAPQRVLLRLPARLFLKRLMFQVIIILANRLLPVQPQIVKL